MTFKQAKQLHNEDEVILKRDNRSLFVIGDVTVEGKTVLVLCSDGNTYTHKELA